MRRGLIAEVWVVHRSGRDSSSVSILRQMNNLETSPIEAALCDRLPALHGILLSETLPPCLRVDIVGCFTGLMRVATKVRTVAEPRRWEPRCRSPTRLATVAEKEGLKQPTAIRLAAIKVPRTMLDIFFRHRFNDVIQKQVSNALHASLARGGAAELRQSWLADTGVVRLLSDAWTELEIDDHSNVSGTPRGTGAVPLPRRLVGADWLTLSPPPRQGAAGIFHQPSYVGNIFEMVVIIRDAMASSEVRRNELHLAVGDEVATSFLTLCDARLPPAERLRRPQVSTTRRSTGPAASRDGLRRHPRPVTGPFCAEKGRPAVACPWYRVSLAIFPWTGQAACETDRQPRAALPDSGFRV